MNGLQQYFSVGDIVDLNDRIFGWRGKYIVMVQKSDSGKVKIKNLATNSQQFVSASRLRRSICEQFRLKA